MSNPPLFLPYLPSHRDPIDTASPSPRLRKAKSLGSLLAPLSGLTRRPAALLEYLLEEFTPLPSAESVAQQELDSQKAVCHLRLRQATTLAEWQAAAVELDALEGNEDWKQTSESADYDHDVVQSKLQELEDARISCDPHRMLFLIRTSLTRYLGRMGNIKLYKHSHIGTKRLIERYIASALDTITSLLDATRRSGSTSIDPRHLLDQIVLARQSFGRSALLLSGGGTFGMNHIGVVKCLWESKLLPRIISGASAGSIVCSVLCTRTDEELPTVLEEFCLGDLDVFTHGESDASTLGQLSRLLKHGALFDIGNLIRVMKNLLGDMTFQEGYNRTRRILNICVSSASLYDLPRLLNYVTAPNVIIWSAVAASCSVPLVFQPAPLLVKDPKTGEAVPWNMSPQSWIDGSVDNDLPMTRLAELFNVNHFIVSQVNPHVVPFLIKEDDNGLSAGLTQRAAIQGTDAGWLHTLSGLARDEVMHRMHVLSELGVFPTFLTKVRSILSQRYSGDITILPEISYAEVAGVLRNPTTDFMLHASASGERATWPKLSRIQNHCAIELALDDAVQQLRARIAFGSSQVNLRALAADRPPSRANSDGGRMKRDRAGRKRLRTSKQGEFDRDQQHHQQHPTKLANVNAATIKPNSSRHIVASTGLTLPELRRHSSSRSRRRTAERSTHRDPVLFQLPRQHADADEASSSSDEGDDDSALDRTIAHLAAYAPFKHASSAAQQQQQQQQHQHQPKQLFPHASQPATPMHAPSSFSFSAATSNHPGSYFPSSVADLAALTSPSPSQQHARTASSSSSPHSASPRLARRPPTPGAVSSPVGAGLGRTGSWRGGSLAGALSASAEDLSGARGMLARKRSVSGAGRG